jgi:hypothetical protein
VLVSWVVAAQARGESSTSARVATHATRHGVRIGRWKRGDGMGERNESCVRNASDKFVRQVTYLVSAEQVA